VRAVRGRRAAAFVLAAIVMILLAACQPAAGPGSPVPVPELPGTPPPPPPDCSTEGDGDGVACDVLIVGDGQSHSNTPMGFAIPDVVSEELGYPLSNVSVGGSSWSTLLTTVHSRLGPVLPDDVASTAVLLMIGGTQDIVEGDTAATVYADAVAYAAAARSLATGPLLIVAATIPPAGPNVLSNNHFTEAEEAVRIAANALVLADESGAFDAAIDIGIAPYDDPTDATYFQVDQTHLTELGARGIAQDIVIPAVEAVLANAARPASTA
jgi:lysophospholipase L1-like esterase